KARDFPLPIGNARSLLTHSKLPRSCGVRWFPGSDRWVVRFRSGVVCVKFSKSVMGWGLAELRSKAASLCSIENDREECAGITGSESDASDALTNHGAGLPAGGRLIWRPALRDEAPAAHQPAGNIGSLQVRSAQSGDGLPDIAQRQ